MYGPYGVFLLLCLQLVLRRYMMDLQPECPNFTQLCHQISLHSQKTSVYVLEHFFQKEI